jgi:hypothetical protein
METFAEKVKEICEIYFGAADAEKKGIHVYSTDEKMGIHAREHKNPSIQMKEGCPEKIDPEYIRHGTSGIIASRNVTTGEIVAPMVQPTRTEEDFAEHIKQVVGLNPDDKNVFVTDNLNTHKSESLVCFVAETEGIPLSELGIKNKKGILRSMATRETFLSNKAIA